MATTILGRRIKKFDCVLFPALPWLLSCTARQNHIIGELHPVRLSAPRALAAAIITARARFVTK